MGDNGDYTAIVEAIVHLAHNLGARVIAEGIENARQRKLLRDISCDYAQGYLFSKPVPARDIAELLARTPPDRRPRLTLGE